MSAVARLSTTSAFILLRECTVGAGTIWRFEELVGRSDEKRTSGRHRVLNEAGKLCEIRGGVSEHAHPFSESGRAAQNKNRV